MKKILLLAGISNLMLGFPNAIHAAEPFYYGAQYSLLDFKDTNTNDTLSPTALSLRLGASISPALAVEARLGTGAREDTEQLITMEIEHLAGLYLVGILKGSQGVSIYGFAGSSSVKADFSSGTAENSRTETDFSYGVGFNFDNFNIEASSLMAKSDFEASGLSIGYKATF